MSSILIFIIKYFNLHVLILFFYIYDFHNIASKIVYNITLYIKLKHIF